MRERDSQRSKVYRAEAAAGIAGLKLETIPEIEKYLKRVFSHEWFKRHHPRAVRFRVTDGRARGSACGGGGGLGVWMKMPRWSRWEGTVLHELAHGLNDIKQHHRPAGHGWEFCEILLGLVRHYQGKDAAERLRLAFKEKRVRYHKPKRGRKLTPEQREAAISRLATARETKAAKIRVIHTA